MVLKRCSEERYPDLLSISISALCHRGMNQSSLAKQMPRLPNPPSISHHGMRTKRRCKTRYVHCKDPSRPKKKCILTTTPVSPILIMWRPLLCKFCALLTSPQCPTVIFLFTLFCTHQSLTCTVRKPLKPAESYHETEVQKIAGSAHLKSLI